MLQFCFFFSECSVVLSLLIDIFSEPRVFRKQPLYIPRSSRGKVCLHWTPDVVVVLVLFPKYVVSFLCEMIWGFGMENESFNVVDEESGKFSL